VIAFKNADTPPEVHFLASLNRIRPSAV